MLRIDLGDGGEKAVERESQYQALDLAAANPYLIAVILFYLHAGHVRIILVRATRPTP